MYDALFVMYCHCSVGEEIQSVFHEYYLKTMFDEVIEYQDLACVPWFCVTDAKGSSFCVAETSSFQEDVFLWMSTFRVMGKGDKPSTKLE